MVAPATLATTTTASAAAGVATEDDLFVDVPITTLRSGPFDIFFSAACRGDLSQVRLIIKHPSFDVDGISPYTKPGTALYGAAKYERTEIMRLLIGSKRVDINKREGNPEKGTAMHIAAFEANAAAAGVLLEFGADVDARNVFDATPLQECFLGIEARRLMDKPLKKEEAYIIVTLLLNRLRVIREREEQIQPFWETDEEIKTFLLENGPTSSPATMEVSASRRRRFCVLL